MEGIKGEWTTLYNLQHNGVAERKNRTIVGVARASYMIRICLSIFGQRHVAQ